MKRAIIIVKGKVQKVGYRDFVQDKIKYGDVPEELGDRLGAALLYLGATNQKIDAGFKMVAGKIDEGRKENKQGFGMLAGKMDMMLEKQEDTIEEISSLRENLKSYVENKFAKIEYEIAGRKAKIGMA